MSQNLRHKHPQPILTAKDEKRVMLDRALSKLGLCSRQEARRAIRAKRVRVNGKITTRHLQWVDLDRDTILLDGQAVRGAEKLVHLMLHKPAGYMTTRRDPMRRPTVYDLLPRRHANTRMGKEGERPRASWIFPVGRLDYESEGLLLFTNDGPLGDALSSPQSHVPKVYRALLHRLPAPEHLQQLAQGIDLGDYVTQPARLHVESPAETRNWTAASPGRRARRAPSRGSWVQISICEGKNRQVRRMFAAVGCEVRRLMRIRLGPLELGDLPPGRTRELSAGEVRALRRAAGMA